jgi:hypothetical protein
MIVKTSIAAAAVFLIFPIQAAEYPVSLKLQNIAGVSFPNGAVIQVPNDAVCMGAEIVCAAGPPA